MSKDRIDAWMPLYVADWDLSTGHLTNEQDGAYGRLVRWYWRNAGPPADDDVALASIVRADMKAWRRMRPTLAAFFTVADGLWTHRRVERELEASRGKKLKAIERAEKAARGRWGREPEASPEQSSGDAQSNAPSMLEQCPSSSSAEVRAPKEALTLSKRDAPILPHEGQSASALSITDTIPLDERKRLAAEVRNSMTAGRPH